jgi:hypothetical protein
LRICATSSCCGYTDHQRGGGDQAIICTKNGGAQPTSTMSAVMKVSLIDIFQSHKVSLPDRRQISGDL